MRGVTFECPICLAAGLRVGLAADIEETEPFATVVDVRGACPHARRFGELAARLDHEWRLVVAALEQYEADQPCP